MLPTLEGPFESQEILRDPYVLLVPADHELGGLERTSIADLGDLTLIGNRACRSTALAEDELVQRGVEVDVAFRSDDNGTVQGLVGAGFGAALVPLLTVDRERRPRQRAGDRARDPPSPRRTRLAPGPAPLSRRARVRGARRRGVRRGRGVPRTRSGLDPLDDCGDRLAEADAHAGDPVARLAAFELVQQRRGDTGARRAERVAERDAAAVRD